MNDLKIIPVRNEMDFESLCLDIARERYGDYNAQKYGRRGQKQWGIDIKATDRKNNHEKIAIQCKFKYDPAKISLDQKKKEIRAELTAALEKHSFDGFVYAANIENDAHLQDYAEELSREYGVSVTVWSQEDMESDIRLFPRLRRLYTLGGPVASVTLIDQDFMEGLELQAGQPVAAKTNIFRFYHGIYANNSQWYGILDNLDAPRQGKAGIDEQLEKLFARIYLENRVAVVVSGGGGTGKSTLLRRIAIDNARLGKYVNWWVEDVNDFLEYDAFTISENREQQHLIFIDDWYRNQPEDSGKEFFRWLKTQTNALVLIGDRRGKGPYTEFLFDNFIISLEPSENQAILDHIAGTSPALSRIITQIRAKDALPNQNSISILLFVIAHLFEQEADPENISLEGGVKTRFQRIIAGKLYALEQDAKYRGLGKALYLLASIYASPRLNYAVFPENFFLQSASLLGENPRLPERIKSNHGFPEEVNALVYRRVAAAQSGEIYKYIHFNHDVLAEEGIIHAPSIYEHLDLETDLYEQEQLLKLFIKERDTTSCIMLWLWLHTEKGFDATYEVLWGILRNGLTHLRGRGDLFFRLKVVKDAELKKDISIYVLSQPDFFKLPSGVVSTALNLLRQEKAGKRAAQTILSQPDFFKLPSSIVSTSLNLLRQEETGKWAAQTILAQPDFFKLPYSIVSTSLNLLRQEEAGKRAAQTILEQPDFFKLPDPIVSTALNLLRQEETGKRAAQTILEQPDFFKLPHQIISTALNLLREEEAGERAVQTILSQADFFKLPKEIVSTALNLLCQEEAGKRAAQTILSQADFLKLPFEIVSKAMNLLREEEVGKRAAQTILSQADFFKLPDSIVSTSLNLLREEEAGKRAAQTILSQVDFFKLPFEIVSTSLNLLREEEAGKRAAQTILILFQGDFFKLPKEIVSKALNLLQQEEEGKQAARIILKHCKKAETFLVFHATKALSISQEPADYQVVAAFLEETYHQKRNVSAGQVRLFFDLLYLPLLDHHIHRKRVFGIIKNYRPRIRRNRKYNTYQVLQCYAQYPDILYFQEEVRQLQKSILEHCVEDLEHQYQHHSHDMITAHILVALQQMEQDALAEEVKERLLRYGEENPLFKDTELYGYLEDPEALR